MLHSSQCYIFLPNFYRQNGHVVSAIFIKNAWPPASWRWSTASKALKASATVSTNLDRPTPPSRRRGHLLRRGVASRRSTGQHSLAGGVWLTCLMALIKLPVYLTVRCVRAPMNEFMLRRRRSAEL